MTSARTTLQFRLFLAFAAITLIAVVVPAVLSRNSLYEDRLYLARQQALTQTWTLAAVFNAGASPEQIAALLTEANSNGLRLTVADPSGKVLHDSHLDGERLEDLDNHNDRPEIEEARKIGLSFSIRHSNSLNLDAVYAAVLLDNGGILRLAVPLADIKRRFESEIASLTAIFLGVTALCLLLSMVITRSFRNGIDTMAEVVAAIARNKGGRRLVQVPGKEFLPLACAVNRMAENIEEYVVETTDQRTQLEVILDSMREGVLVLGPNGAVRRANRAMRDLFPGIDQAMGKQLIEAVPVPALQRWLDDVLAGQNTGNGGGARESVHFELPAGRFLVAHLSSPVEGDHSLGAVMVVYDATEIMRLERVRRDFVANVSHELRTPLTAISGYAEILMDTQELDAAHRNFAGIIHKHAQSLAKVIEEMLALARIEDAGEAVVLAPVDPNAPLLEAMRLCREQADCKKLRFSIDIPAGCLVQANASLLTQVYRNLLENACRYSPDGGEIVVRGEIRDGEVLISVMDQGPGIADKDLSRIFERLYQVKKQRNSGSSGIGLAISKHIVERHGGRIWAESPYQGFATAMLFTLRLAEGQAQTQARP